MQIVRDLGGYSLGRSDLLRRAMGKKKTDVMLKEREIFLNGDGKDVSGCITKGIPKEIGERIFDDMVDFAKYAFNKSHAAAYAVVAYQTAYLKAYYKVEFMAALMTSVMDVSAKIRSYIDSCKKMNIQVVAPDINEGYAYFSTKDNKIMYGLVAIKNVGKNVVDRIVLERSQNGNFTSITDFYTRLDAKDTNKRSIESLILAGAFDSLGGTRSQYMAVYQQIANGIAINKKKNIEGQIDIFGLSSNEETQLDDNLPDIREYDLKELLTYEKEVMGIYLSGHPLDKVTSILERYISHKSVDLEWKEEEPILQDGERVAVGGMLVEKKVTFTKNNKKMAFITLEDTVGTMEIIIFPNLYEKFEALNTEEVFVVKGRISIKDEEAGVVIADDITTLENIINPTSSPHILLRLSEEMRTKEIRQKLIVIFSKYKGNAKVIVESTEDGSKKEFPTRYNVTINDNIIQDLCVLLGASCVQITKKI